MAPAGWASTEQAAFCALQSVGPQFRVAPVGLSGAVAAHGDYEQWSDASSGRRALFLMFDDKEFKKLVVDAVCQWQRGFPWRAVLVDVSPTMWEALD